MPASISIILPNLNHLRYLPQRIESILSQTFKNWECIVIDGYSNDGSWEYLKEKTCNDKRFHLYREPPEGAYDAWNKGISKANGKYIYIATSDDTMKPTCLQVLLNGLERHPQCKIAHCCLTIIDEDGSPHSNQWDQWEKVTFFGDLIKKPHIRYAPYDVFLHGGWSTVYTSATQLLINKELFNEIGLFRTDLGASADFEWGVRLAFATNILHIPEYLATWRLHPNQLSNYDFYKSHEFTSKLCDMIVMAYNEVGHLSHKITEKEIYDLLYIYRRQTLVRAFKRLSFYEYTKLFLSTSMCHKKAGRDFLINILSFNTLKKMDVKQYIRELTNKYAIEIQIVDLI